MNKEQLTECGFKPSIYTLPSVLLKTGLSLLMAESCDKEKINAFKRASKLADHLQMKYMIGRPSILMAAITYLELRKNNNPRQLKEVGIAFDVSEKSLRKRVRWVQSMGFYIRNRVGGTSQRANPSLETAKTAGRLAIPQSGEKDKGIATFETGWGKVSFKRS